LLEQIFDRVLDQRVDDFCQGFGMPVGHHPRRRLIRRALPRHHIGRDRPRRAAETDQRYFRIELAAHAAQRFMDRFEFCEVGPGRERCNLVRRVQRIEPRAFADLEGDRAPERVGDDENVREDDRGIEVEAADRLQRDFGGEFRREAQIEKAAGFRPHFAVLRQISPGLPHHPDRRHLLAMAREHFKQWFNGGFLGQSNFLQFGGLFKPPDTCRQGQGQGENGNLSASQALSSPGEPPWLRKRLRSSILPHTTSMPPIHAKPLWLTRNCTQGWKPA
jgi:hypothetical protein